MEIGRRAFVAGGMGVLAAPALSAVKAVEPVTGALAAFITNYMAVQNAPGMIVGMADSRGWSDTAAYGVADIEARRPIHPDERFHIGSITKSFTALMTLQLVEEGKVRLDADITRYLPGLPLRTPFAPVTVHHLLRHASGLQSEAPAIGWSDQTVEQAFAPGTRFHYCNMGYAWLGRIIVARGGEDWARALHRRVLDPLGMTRTSALIGPAMRQWEVPNYQRREDDRPFPKRGALTRAAPLIFTDASGCIASTAADMTKYIAMLLRRGQAPGRRLLSPESFALMVQRHIAAAEFGPNGGYGYGWMTDEVDGLPVIRHTGGMNAFMSSIHVHLAAGVGAFASINAQQNYRPVPVTAEALRLCRARAKGSPLTTPVAFDPDKRLDLAEYAGDYLREDGSVARVTVAGKGLGVALNGAMLHLENLGDDAFMSFDSRFRLFTFLFRREKPLADAIEGQPNPVQAMGWGRDGYVRRGAKPPVFAVADRSPLSITQLRDYEGLYVGAGGWLTSVRVIARDGRLWVDSFDGAIPLASVGDDRFRFANETDSPEIAAFSVNEGLPRTLSIAGCALVRVGDPFTELA